MDKLLRFLINWMPDYKRYRRCKLVVKLMNLPAVLPLQVGRYNGDRDEKVKDTLLSVYF